MCGELSLKEVATGPVSTGPGRFPVGCFGGIFIMNSKVILGCSLVWGGALCAASASSLMIEPGVSYVRISGVRSYAARENLSHNDTSHVTSPFVRLAYAIDDAWSVGIQYSRYTSLLGSGASPNTDVFHDGGASAQVITTVNSAERIQEFAVDVRYRLKISEPIGFEIGPVVSCFQSKAQIWPNDPTATFVAGHVPGRSFSASDVNVGGVAALRATLTSDWSVSASYRLATPPDRTLHLFTATVAYRF